MRLSWLVIGALIRAAFTPDEIILQLPLKGLDNVGTERAGPM